MALRNEQHYWTDRYQHSETGWDIGYPSTPIKNYVDQLEDRSLRILLPGAGNAWEAEYLWQQGFLNTFVLDISAFPLEQFSARVPDFPKDQLIQQNFFDHRGSYDLILEQTFFCSFSPSPENRQRYVYQMAELLVAGGKLAGVWFKFPLDPEAKAPPYGGSREEYLPYFTPCFDVQVLEECHNSIVPRQGNELFGIFKRKEVLPESS